MNITRAKPEDAGSLTDIAFAGKRHWGYPEGWIKSWRVALTVLPEFLNNHQTWIATVEGQRVGFYALARKDDKLELLHLWVLPNAMRQGVGRALFIHALERMKELGFRELEIESDPNAEGFYRRMGAQRVGTSIKKLKGRDRELPVLVYNLATTINQVTPSQSANFFAHKDGFILLCIELTLRSRSATEAGEDGPLASTSDPGDELKPHF